MKHFGIYLAYGPRVNMRGEGLGRHLAEFLKASSDFNGARFLVAAPGWLRGPLNDLFEEFKIDRSRIEVISPAQPSTIFRIYQVATFITSGRKKTKKRIDGRSRLKSLVRSISSWAEATGIRIFRSRNPLTFSASIVGLILAVPMAAVALVVGIMLAVGIKVSQVVMSAKPPRCVMQRTKARAFLTSLSHGAYRLMCDIEASAVAELASSRDDVAAWYAPAAFWPEFNSIKAPRVMCVPDAVQAHHSIPFAADGPHPERAVPDYKRLEDAIENGDRFVTYSDDVKQRVLVNHFNVDPSRINVVPHGTNRLDHLIKVSGFPDEDAATDALSAVHLRFAFSKAFQNATAFWYASEHAGFLFYASQFRPNKNVLTLLRAYEYLVTEKRLPYRLVLTGDANQAAAIKSFIYEKQLDDNVFFVRGLTEVELASCYRLATLSVNPSLAEGGMPFTFTESVSVGTPVVMADIAVTREILTDERVAEATLFDPYDFRALARKIEVALDQKDELLKLQTEFYHRRLIGRSYRDVVEETIAILDAAAANRNVLAHPAN